MGELLGMQLGKIINDSGLNSIGKLPTLTFDSSEIIRLYLEYSSVRDETMSTILGVEFCLKRQSNYYGIR